MTSSTGAASKDGSSFLREDFPLYKLMNNPPKYEWFSVRDLGQRYLLAIVLHYYLLLTHPISYSIYTLRWNCLWYYTLPGLVLTLFLPVLPAALVVVVALEQIRNRFKQSWMQGCPGETFYTKPDSTLSCIIWELWLNISMYTSIFLLTGCDPDGVRASLVDEITTKEFWFEIGRKCEARFPRQLFHWNGSDMELNSGAELRVGKKLILKLYDSYLGIGDQVYQRGDPPAEGPEDEVIYFRDMTHLEELIGQHESYQGKPGYGAEFLEAPPALGVHQSDILTLQLKNGDVRVLRSIFWGDCTGHTSHSATSAYFVDIKSGTIKNPIRWYAPAFKNAPADRVGSHVAGTSGACEKAVEMHYEISKTIPWCRAIGWDCMTTGDDEPQVFFEGNFAGSRFRRHIFASPAILMETIRVLAPPF